MQDLGAVLWSVLLDNKLVDTTIGFAWRTKCTHFVHSLKDCIDSVTDIFSIIPYENRVRVKYPHAHY